MDKSITNQAWNTGDEIDAINYMSSTELRAVSGRIQTLSERKQKLRFWLDTYAKRRWGKGVDLMKCYDHASEVYNKLSKGG